MLFRPLKPWHVLGLRIPMTPGVIPSKRHVLAENIGEMVGTHLLTAKDIGSALSDEPFQEHLHGVVDRRIKDILERDFGPLTTLIPDKFQPYYKAGLKTVNGRLCKGLQDVLQSDQLVVLVAEAMSGRLQAMGDQDVDSLVDAQKRQVLYSVISQMIQKILAGEQVEKWLGSYLINQLEQSAQKGQSIKDILPEEIIALIEGTIRDQSPHLLKQIGRMVSEPVFRNRIIKGVLSGVDHFLESLGPMGAMARGFFDKNTVEEKIDSYLNEKEEDLLKWLQNPEVCDRMTDILLERVDAFFARPLTDLIEKVGEKRCETVCKGIAGKIAAHLRSPETGEQISTLLRDRLEELLDNGQRSLASLAEEYCKGSRGEALRSMLCSQVVTMLRSPEVAKLLNRLTDSLVVSLVSRPVGVLGELVPPGLQRSITHFIVLQTNRMLLKEVPGLVGSLHIQGVVTDKVNSLDLLKLEGLLLSIMEEQFKYINLFGALLGFIIGLINLVILKLA